MRSIHTHEKAKKRQVADVNECKVAYKIKKKPTNITSSVSFKACLNMFKYADGNHIDTFIFIYLYNKTY